MANNHFKINGSITGDLASMYPDTLLNTLLNTQFNIPIKKLEHVPKKEEKWIWVTGYKGTDRDMNCRGYQFELGKKHDMPDDAVISTCHSGFHFCKDLKSVFNYYNVGDGNRFFEVTALVREDEYNHTELGYYFTNGNDKYAAKSITFTRELTVDEILADKEYSDWSAEWKKLAIERGPTWVKNQTKVKELVELGYNEALAEYLVYNADFTKAKALGSQKDISMDTRILALFRVTKENG